MHLFSFAGNGAGRAVFQALLATFTELQIDLHVEEATANPSRAMLPFDVRQEFIFEVAQRSENGVAGGSSQSAQCRTTTRRSCNV